MSYSGQRPSAGTSKVISAQTGGGGRQIKRTRGKHPTKLVKAAASCLLSPPMTMIGWILRGHSLLMGAPIKRDFFPFNPVVLPFPLAKEGRGCSVY